MVLLRTPRRLSTLASFMMMGFTLLCRRHASAACSPWRGKNAAFYASSSKYGGTVLSRTTPSRQRADGSQRPPLRRLGSGTDSSRGVDPAPDSDASEPATRQHRRHEKTYRIRGETHETSRPGVRVRTDTGHEVTTDLPRTMGGNNSAPQPVEMLLTALVGCTQATALFVGRNVRPRRLDIERMVFDVRAARDERGALRLPIDSDPEVPSRLLSVDGTVRVHLTNSLPISEAELQLLKEQTELRCPVANMMIASGCEMNVDWLDGSAEIEGNDASIP